MPAFRKLIIPSRVSHIHSVDLRKSTEKSAKQALGVLHLLPNLRALLVDATAAVSLFDDIPLLDPTTPVEEIDDVEFRRIAFRQVAVRVETLSLTAFTHRNLGQTLACFPHLQSLTLVNAAESITTAAMLKVLEKTPKLVELRLRVNSPLSSNPILIDDDWAALPWPPLSSLIVESVPLDEKLCAVIN